MIEWGTSASQKRFPSLAQIAAWEDEEEAAYAVRQRRRERLGLMWRFTVAFFSPFAHDWRTPPKRRATPALVQQQLDFRWQGAIFDRNAPPEWRQHLLRCKMLDELAAVSSERARLFGADLASDPVLDILLDLFNRSAGWWHASEIASQVGHSTGTCSRWLKVLHGQGLVDYRRTSALQAGSNVRPLPNLAPKVRISEAGRQRLFELADVHIRNHGTAEALRLFGSVVKRRGDLAKRIEGMRQGGSGAGWTNLIQ